MQLPHNIIGWTIFGTGLLLTLYRLHGIDSPRPWVEWIERQFAYAINLRFIGGILIAAVVALGYFGGIQATAMGWLFLGCLVLLGLVGLGLLIFQNHLRHIVFASAEGSDKMLRITSIVVVIIGLGLCLAPFFLI
jgi:hypothetical protein